jgi:hypothetical protein
VRLVTYSGILRSSAAASLGPKLAGHLYLNYKAFTTE